MIIYNWDCRNVEAYIEQAGNADVVYKVHYRVNGTSDVLNPEGIPIQATVIGVASLDTSNITNFIPWDEVTETEVEAWTKAAIGETMVLETEANIANQIALLIAPVSISLTVGQPVPE